MKKIILLACVAAIACGDDDAPMTDAGMADGGMPDVVVPDTGPTPDTGPGPDAGPPVDSGPAPENICDPGALENVTADAAEVVLTTIDTSSAVAPPEALEACGNELTGQVVVAITIPGDAADQVIEVSTNNPRTEMFDTILDLRTECGTEGVCFDDADGVLLSRGTIIGDGGDTVFALVSGYGADDEGIVELSTEVLGTAGGAGDSCETLPCGGDLLCNAMSVCQAPAAVGESCENVACAEGLVCGATEICETAEAPVLTAATTVRYDDLGEDDETSLAMGVTGTDANGDVVSLNFTFLDAAGDDFDFLGEGGDLTFVFGLDEVAGLASFMEATFVNAGPSAMFAAEAVGFRISVNDSAGLESNEITGDITAGMFSDVGGSCGFTSICDPDAMLVCGATDECEAPVAPVLTAATTVRYDNLPDGEDMVTLLAMGLTGTDANADVVAFNFTFVDAAGDDFDFLGEGDPTFTFGLEEAANLASFMEAAFIGGGPTGDFPAEAVGYRISLVDSAELESNELTGDITAGMFAADGASCAFTNVCDPAAMLICNDDDVCEAAPAP